MQSMLWSYLKSDEEILAIEKLHDTSSMAARPPSGVTADAVTPETVTRSAIDEPKHSSDDDK